MSVAVVGEDALRIVGCTFNGEVVSRRHYSGPRKEQFIEPRKRYEFRREPYPLWLSGTQWEARSRRRTWDVTDFERLGEYSAAPLCQVSDSVSPIMLQRMSPVLAQSVGYCDAAILPVLGAKRTLRGQRECVEFAE